MGTVENLDGKKENGRTGRRAGGRYLLRDPFPPAEEREKDAADEFAMLFDPTTGPDEEVEQRLFRLQQQRRERVRAAMEEAGVSLEEVDAAYGYGFAESSVSAKTPHQVEEKHEEPKEKQEEKGIESPVASAPGRPNPDEEEEKISVSTEETRNLPDEEEEPHRGDGHRAADTQEEDLKNLLLKLEHRSDLPPAEAVNTEKAAPAAVHTQDETTAPQPGETR